MPSEKDRNQQQVPFRLHINDHKVMKKLLIDDELKFQTFMTACVEAYLRGDPAMVKLLETYKDLNTIPREERAKYTLSRRERNKILDDIVSEPEAT